MQKRQLLGIVVFALGGASFLASFLFSTYIVSSFFSFGPIPTSSGLLQVAGFFIIAATGFVPFFLVGLGLYLIFKPMLMIGSQVTPMAPNVPASEKQNREEIKRIKSLTDDDLAKELVSMKTIEHVLVPRLATTPNENTPQSAEMAQMLKKTRDRITALDAELRQRRQIQEQKQLTAVRH